MSPELTPNTRCCLVLFVLHLAYEIYLYTNYRILWYTMIYRDILYHDVPANLFLKMKNYIFNKIYTVNGIPYVFLRVKYKNINQTTKNLASRHQRSWQDLLRPHPAPTVYHLLRPVPAVAPPAWADHGWYTRKGNLVVQVFCVLVASSSDGESKLATPHWAFPNHWSTIWQTLISLHWSCPFFFVFFI